MGCFQRPEARLASHCYPAHAHLVLSGFDWRWFLATRNPALRSWMWPAVGIWRAAAAGLAADSFCGRLHYPKFQNILAGWAIGQAELLGAFVAAFTRQLRVTFIRRTASARTSVMSSVFGWMRAEFLGLAVIAHHHRLSPLAVTVFTLCPNNGGWVGWRSFTPAMFGLGVSMTIPLVLGFRGRSNHWVGHRSRGWEKFNPT